MFIYLRAADKCGKKRYTINRVQDGCFSFFEVVFYKKVRPCVLRRAVKKCGRYLPIAAEPEIKLPHELKPRQIATALFDLQLLANAFFYVTRGQKTALIYDPDGRFSPFALRIILAVSELYICTRQEEIYSEICHEALKKLGCSPLLLPRADFKIFPAALTLKKEPAVRASLLFGSGGFLPLRDKVLFKGRCESYILAAAKYCCGGGKNAQHYLPERLSNGSLEASPEQLKKMLDTHLYATYN